jgi:predicted aminopeptidase
MAHEMWPVAARLSARLLATAGTLLVCGCATLSYYGDAAIGHLSLLEAARPIDAWLADPRTPEILRARLTRARDIRSYASRELALPDNSSYINYASLNRSYVVWNVLATPPLSLELRQWCFPIAGCVTYRGYFTKAGADAFAAQLRGDGLDVTIGGVPAYSTLGHTPDPILSTFINYPDPDLARLIFHELAHQEFYLPGDSTFNESFASTVEEEGVRRWLEAQNDPRLSEEYRQSEARHLAFVAMVEGARATLEQAYHLGPDDAARGAAKVRILDDLRARYLRARDDPASPLYGDASYSAFFGEHLNNASLSAIATYTQRVPAFVKLLKQEHGDLPRFYAAVKGLGALGEIERDARLDLLQGNPARTVTAGSP